MSIQKIVLKGTGKISLHERFTQLKFEGSHDWETNNVDTGLRRGGVDRYAQGSSRSYSRESSSLYTNLQQSNNRPSSLLYSARDRSVQRSIGTSLEKKPFGPSSTILAATRIKRKSILQRFGVKARLSMSRSRFNFTNRNRWGSTGSLNSSGTGHYR